ncbi:MAG: NAD kinase [Cytophagales bacterium]|nr:NAD kinase [Cytophagales bacterium]MDW8385059.1 NAD kinase [Flammeovirgaceae bacterium]
MKIGIHSRFFAQEKLVHFKTLLKQLTEMGTQLWITPNLIKHLESMNFRIENYVSLTHQKKLKELDYMLSIGGDGSLLETVTYVKDSGVPILGVNLGTMGFLATISPKQISESLVKLFEKRYTIEHRTLIQVESNYRVFKNLNFGLNEFAILKRDTSSMITVHTHINGMYLTSYWADGLIVSTPTGSTGYCLSVGGPVVTPESKSFVVAPVSPHNLNMRPLVVSDDSVLNFEIEGRGKKFLISLDSRSKVVDASIRLQVQKCPFLVKLIRLEGDNFFNTLKHKLNWGLDTRN